MTLVGVGPRRFDGGDARNGARRRLERGEIFVDPAVELRRIEVAGDDQHGVVGAVIGRVEGADVVDRRAVEVGDAADRRAGIRVDRVTDRRQVRLEQLAIGARLALAQFLLDDVPFAGEDRGVDDERPHPLGLGEQQGLEVVGGDDLVIFGEVVVGRGVVVAADVLGQPVELFGDEVARAT